jgi:hypothetical protein
MKRKRNRMLQMLHARMIVLAAAAVLCGAHGAQALVCPMPQSVAKPGVIAEPESAIVALSPMLRAGDAVQRAPEIVAAVRKRFPAAKPEELVNFLVTAYCPVANERQSSEAEKQALVNAFAAAVTEQLY